MSSYPPLTLPLTQDKTGYITELYGDSELLPVIDLQNCNPTDIGKAFRHWGVFRLVNHGIPETLSAELHKEIKKLFELSFDTKRNICTEAGIPYFWGTAALDVSNEPNKMKNVNWLEGLNMILSELQHLKIENRALVSFRSMLEEHGQHMSRVSKSIFEAIVTDLGLDLMLTEYYLSNSTELMRIYRYPHCSEVDKVFGLSQHTDSSIISIISQDNTGGLEIIKDDTWFIIKPVPNTLIVNLGDMLQVLSDDVYQSVTHRVKVNQCQERISLCYFLFPDEDRVLRSKKYRPFNYREFKAQTEEDTRTTGFKIGLPRFKLQE